MPASPLSNDHLPQPVLDLLPSARQEQSELLLPAHQRGQPLS